ncbi:MAG: bis(5'-nucleosyl)-tetraphosphatase (symmetrical) YqeK [Mycoplasmatales bacterium]
MSKFRFNHTKSVMKTAIILSKKYVVDEEKVIIAALCHDMTKEDKSWNIDSLKKIGITDIEILSNPLLWHGYTASFQMKEHFNVEDEEILNAVKFHTVGNEKMNSVAKIIYIADSIEPLRGDIKFFNHIINSNKTLNGLLFEVAIRKMNYLIKSGKNVHPSTKKMLKSIKNTMEK